MPVECVLDVRGIQWILRGPRCGKVGVRVCCCQGWYVGMFELTVAIYQVSLLLLLLLEKAGSLTASSSIVALTHMPLQKHDAHCPDLRVEGRDHNGMSSL